MSNTGILVEAIEKKQELAEREEESTRRAIEDSINTRLQNRLKEVPNGEFLEALRDERYLYVCLKMPRFENKLTRIGKMYTEAVNKILKQQNEANPKYFLKVETNKTLINYIIRSRKSKDCVGNVMNTFIIHIIGKENAEKLARV
jgi:hypothetical protein